MPFIDSNQMRTYFEWSGEKDLPVLVLSNSLGADLSMWNTQIEEFSKHFRLLRYDTRGHGKSVTTAGTYTIEQLGSDVITMLDALSLRRVAFCGLSMGGMIGQWLAIHARHYVDQLILANTAAKIGTAESWNARIGAVLEEGMQVVVPSILDRWFTREYRALSPGTVTNTSHMLAAANPIGYTACCAAIRDMDMRESVQRIDAPTLVIAGSADTATSPAEGRYLADQIAGARYLCLHAAHLSNIEAASEFTAAAIGFLKSERKEEIWMKTNAMSKE
jgi:3-oxoadipate enol-lactonase